MTLGRKVRAAHSCFVEDSQQGTMLWASTSQEGMVVAERTECFHLVFMLRGSKSSTNIAASTDPRNEGSSAGSPGEHSEAYAGIGQVLLHALEPPEHETILANCRPEKGGGKSECYHQWPPELYGPLLGQEQSGIVRGSLISAHPVYYRTVPLLAVLHLPGPRDVHSTL